MKQLEGKLEDFSKYVEKAVWSVTQNPKTINPKDRTDYIHIFKILICKLKRQMQNSRLLVLLSQTKGSKWTLNYNKSIGKNPTTQ